MKEGPTEVIFLRHIDYLSELPGDSVQPGTTWIVSCVDRDFETNF